MRRSCIEPNFATKFLYLSIIFFGWRLSFMDWLVHEPGMSVNNCVLCPIVEVLICACANSSQVVNIKVTVLLDALKGPLNHNLFDSSCACLTPRETISAGFYVNQNSDFFDPVLNEHRKNLAWCNFCQKLFSSKV